MHLMVLVRGNHQSRFKWGQIQYSLITIGGQIIPDLVQVQALFPGIHDFLCLSIWAY